MEYASLMFMIKGKRIGIRLVRERKRKEGLWVDFLVDVFYQRPSVKYLKLSMALQFTPEINSPRRRTKNRGLSFSHCRYRFNALLFVAEAERPIFEVVISMFADIDWTSWHMSNRVMVSETATVTEEGTTIGLTITYYCQHSNNTMGTCGILINIYLHVKMRLDLHSWG